MYSAKMKFLPTDEEKKVIINASNMIRAKILAGQWADQKVHEPIQWRDWSSYGQDGYRESVNGNWTLNIKEVDSYP